MFRSKNLLVSSLRPLRCGTGAEAVSLYLPPVSAEPASAILVHDGDSPAIAELADLDKAWAFSRAIENRGAAGDDRPSTSFLRVFSTASTDGLIVRLAPPEALLEQLSADWEGASEKRPQRRRTDAGDDRSAALAVWIGLRFGDDGSHRRANMSHRLQDPDIWLAWMLTLVRPLASHVQQFAAMLDDPVSGLPSRTKFQTSLRQGIDRARSRRSSLALALVNPDDFAVVNENFGREAGDATVREIADRLRESLRSGDHFGLYGGAVFALSLPDTDERTARLVAQKLWRTLSEGAYLQGTVRLGFALGLAVYDPTDDEEPAAAALELIRRADQALNLAKQSADKHFVVWQASGQAAQVESFDRLSGIFTAHLAKDYRNMLLLWDTVTIVSSTGQFEVLAAGVVERLFATFRANRVGLFAWSDDDEYQLVEGRSRLEAPLELVAEQRRLLDRSRRRGEVQEAFRDDGEPGTRTFCCAVPLIARERHLGCLYAEGSEGSLDSSDLIFLKALAGQLAISLDRARLAAQERARLEWERQRLRAELHELRQALSETKLVYRSAEMDTVVRTLQRLAPTDATLLITGESGTGKELLARTAHTLSPRSKGPFVVVDCGAIAASLIDRELFGHEKGAYTGAEKRGAGRLMEAGGGTLLLDEIGELPLEVQSKFLRFTQEKQLTPVGGTRTRKVDVRLIAVTNRDLEKEVAAGRFRFDLFYRLNVGSLVVPPLRDRRDDILHLADHFLKRFALQYQKGVRQLSSEAEVWLLEYLWPGNVRELQNRIMKAVILCDGDEIGLVELGLEPRSPSGTSNRSGARDSVDLTAEPPGAAPSRSLPRSASDSRRRAHHQTYQEAWAALGAALDVQIEAALRVETEMPVPLGRWLAEDLILETDVAVEGVLTHGAVLLGLPLSTFRRKLRKASAQTAAGLSPRSLAWQKTRPLIAGLLRATGDSGQEIFLRARTMLLERIVSRLPGKVAAGAALMGVTEPTFRRWAGELPKPRS